MYRPSRTFVLASLVLVSLASPRAQTAPDASGHWVGTIEAQGKATTIEVDLARNGSGDLAGTISIPAQNLKGLPLAKVAVEGRTITFYARADQVVSGVLSADGTSMSADFTTQGFAIPFTLTRTGNATIEPAPTSAAIGRELEGTWNGTLDVNGTQLRLVLTMANHPDGTSTGSFTNLDQGPLTIPVSTITQAASAVTLELKIVGGTYSGSLNKEGTELVGTYAQGPLNAPVTFRRASSDGRK